MQFNAIVDSRVRTRTACAVVGVYENADLGAPARQLDARMQGAILRLCNAGDFAAKLGDTLLLIGAGGSPADRILLVGLGTRASFGRKQYRKAVLAAATALSRTGAEDAVVHLTQESVPDVDVKTRSRIVAEVFCNHAYRIPDLKTPPKPKPPRLARVQTAVADARSPRTAASGLAIGEALGAGMAFARDLANLPPNVCTPRYLASRAQGLAKQWPVIQTKIHDEEAIRALKMGAFMAVTQGSDEPPRLIVCEYHGGRKNAPPVVLVGKGITFDSGGISLKEPPAMDEMKFDMCGAATVLGTLRAVAQLKLRLNLVVIVAACENMPGGRAVKPSDIVTTLSGQTVEILNTDAEGRLILCDALTFSRRFNPAAVVDVATLTGACVVALGNHMSGLMSNDEALARELLAAGQRADDRAWHMPIGEEYADQLKSNFADIANIGGREGGACTAASFLSKFSKDLSWAHLDIAGTAWLGGTQKGSTGRPVPLLLDFLVNRAQAR